MIQDVALHVAATYQRDGLGPLPGLGKMGVTSLLAFEGPTVCFEEAMDIIEARFWRPRPDSLDQSVELGHGLAFIWYCIQYHIC